VEVIVPQVRVDDPLDMQITYHKYRQSSGESRETREDLGHGQRANRGVAVG
jgi:hypothetical protein